MKHKVYLFGSMTLATVPPQVEQHLIAIMEQTNRNVEFIVGDSSGIDSGFHMVLSRIGARDITKVYCADYVRNNQFDLPVEMFDSGGLIGRELYEVKEREMINDCTFAICVWNGDNKGSTFSNISILKAQDKPVYVYTVQVR